jgi:mannose-6-phosphate isomerase-like protein (cupin superfamily)
MNYEAINLADKLARVSERWSPRVVARVNDYEFKLVRVEGEFVWHKHDETDEAFVVIAGEMRIEFRDGTVSLRAGEMFVVPRGVEHKPVAERECQIMVVEPSNVVNTGDAGGELTAANDVWI